MKNAKNKQSDIEECKFKINKLLNEYNWDLISADGWSRVLLIDNDTQETLLIQDN